MLTAVQIPARLRQARSEAGLKEATAAVAADLSLQDLSALEQGSRPPTALEVEKLAAALGLTAAELLGDTAPEPTAVAAMLRGNPGAPEDLGALLGRLASIARTRAELTGLLKRVSPDDLDDFDPAGPPPDQPWRQAELLAGELRQRLSLGIAPIRSIVDLVDELGIHLVWTRALPASVRGLSLIDPRRYGRAIVLNLAEGMDQYWVQRSTLAHELCHVLYDRDRTRPIGVVSRRAAQAEREPLEQRANAFACYFLVPREAVRRFLFSRSVRKGERIEAEIVQALANYFGVGIDLLTTHLMHLGWIDETERASLLAAPYRISTDLDRESPERRAELGSWRAAGVELERLCLVGPVSEALAKRALDAAVAKELLGLSPFDELPEAVGDGLP